MATWDPHEYGVDRSLIAAGFVTKFLRQGVLDDTVARLKERNYRIARVDAAKWPDVVSLHISLAAALEFPPYYGHNFSALMDCLRDVGTGDYGWNPAVESGLVLVIDGFEAFWHRDAQSAQVLVETYATAAAEAAWWGNRMLGLLKCEDPLFDLGFVAPQQVSWNPAEWLDTSRDPGPPKPVAR